MNIIIRDNTRATPLHEAASSGFEEVVVLLIKNKANINTENWRQVRKKIHVCKNCGVNDSRCMQWRWHGDTV